MIAQTVCWFAVFMAVVVPTLAGLHTFTTRRTQRRIKHEQYMETVDRALGLERPRADVKTTVLRADARAGRRHADEFGFPYAVWDLLEAFWSLDDEQPEPRLYVPPTLRPVEEFDFDAFVERTRRRHVARGGNADDLNVAIDDLERALKSGAETLRSRRKRGES